MIEVRHDSERGCGFRKPGGIYLISEGVSFPCGRLPVPLDCCPTCGQGVKASRGWQWVDAGELLTKRHCDAPASRCATCPTITGRHGLIWIGEQFYPTPEAWLEETTRLGVSRRVKAVPNDFKIGETWVLVAHRKAIRKLPLCGAPIDLVRTCERAQYHEGHHDAREGDYTPAIFQAFKPTAIEYVVKGDETDEELAAIEKRGMTPVKVVVDGKAKGHAA